MRRFGEFLRGHEDGRALRAGIELGAKAGFAHGNIRACPAHAATEFALLGAAVTLMARNEEKLKEVIKSLDVSKAQNHEYIVADFQIPQTVKNSIDRYLAKKKSINILINNTGGPKAGNAVDATQEDFLQAFSTHLICNHILVQATLPSMKSTGYGRIVNIILDKVTVDLNHPFAGKPLLFSGEVVEVREAHQVELEHGHVHEHGDHSHH